MAYKKKEEKKKKKNVHNYDNCKAKKKTEKRK